MQCDAQGTGCWVKVTALNGLPYTCRLNASLPSPNV